MDKFSITAIGLAASLLAHAAHADSSWTGTLPRYAALCASGSSGNPDDLGRALEGFAGHLANKGIVTIGFPFVRSLILKGAADGAAPSAGAWEICAPASEAVKAPGEFTTKIIEAESVAFLVCKPPIEGCAQKLLTKLGLPNESPRIASLRSAPLSRLETSIDFETAAGRAAAMLEVVRADTVRVDGPDPASLAPSTALPIDVDLAEKRPPRALYVQPALSGQAVDPDRETAVLVMLAIDPPQNSAAASPVASKPIP